MPLYDDEDDDQLGEPEAPKRVAAPRIASEMPAVTARGLSSPSLSPKQPPSQPSPLQAKASSDMSELGRLQNTGSGISQINNPFARGALRGLNIIGSIAAPHLMSLIPGTEEHHEGLLGRQEGMIDQDLGNEKNLSKIGLTQAQTGQLGAQTKKIEQDTQLAGQPKPKEEHWTPITQWTDIDGTPLIHEENSGQMVRATDRKQPTGFKSTAAAKESKPDTPEQQFIDEYTRTHPNATVAQAITAYAAATQKPERAGAGDQRASARSDKSYQYNQGRLDKVRQPIDQLAARMGRLQDTLNQQNPQADALVAPELLTVMAGGMGSGLRMNEAEISRIVGGRSAWENLKGKIQHWSTNPDDARSITPDQDRMIRALVQEVGTKIQKKQDILEHGQRSLLDSEDPHDHRRIMADVQKQLDDIDAGNFGQQQGQGPKAGTVEGGYRFKGGNQADKANWEPVTAQ